MLHFIEADALVLLQIEAFEEFRFVNIFILEHRVDWDIKGDVSQVNLGRLRVIIKLGPVANYATDAIFGSLCLELHAVPRLLCW